MTQTPPERTGGTGTGHREVTLRRVALGEYEATNARGGTIRLGGGDSADFTPVELFLASIAGCSSVDVDHVTSRRSEPLEFEVVAQGEKVRDDGGNSMTDIEVRFRLVFADDETGERARSMVQRAVDASHDRLCTVSRTVQAGTPVTMIVEGADSA